MSERAVNTYRVKGGFHARDADLCLTAFGESEEAALAELGRLQRLAARLGAEFAASPNLDRRGSDRVA
jgi:hypothetical protein